MRWLYHDCTGSLGLFHRVIDFDSRANVMPNGELGRAWATKSDSRIMSNALSGPKRELQTRLQIKESDSSILELCANYALGR